jgi:hypothetical protein
MQDLLDADHPSDLVHWNNVAGVPQGLVDAAEGWLQDGEVDYTEIQELPDWLADGDVDFGDLQGLPSWLADGQVSYADLGPLPTDSVSGDTVDDGTLTGDDIHDGTLTSDDIGDGSLRAADLAQGAVTPEKVTAQAQSAADVADPPTLTGGDLAPLLTAAVDAPADNTMVAITGQVQLTFEPVGVPGTVETAQIEYQLVRTDSTGPHPVSPIYREDLSSISRQTVASVSLIQRVATGTHGYQIRLVRSDTGTGTFTHSGAVLNVQVLGVS